MFNISNSSCINPEECKEFGKYLAIFLVPPMILYFLSVNYLEKKDIISPDKNENYLIVFNKNTIMKDRKTRTKEIRKQWIEETKIVRKSFWGRQAYVDFWPDDCPYSPPKRRAFGLPEEWWQDKQLDLEWLYERRGYNQIYKQHVMAYRIINRWKSARVNLNTPLGRKVASKIADEYEQGL